ncbi:ATP phosphoribosyltransferase regulatory subunit [Anoxybacter fermentans]|uniref:ATP phosphoribosyltransferase regulatory subunit n=1 Tax=Anoxybacter fermentans TaxID=1323375 RepID=A0A3Q9HTE8_9FIRM|nr:ATP phosphoribosyltransferase regulatory subunit [Anoxybacter fermentans]AZR74033.1 ATP phosphoribosyltransferase regulatory subunit [Anoxybacter fermentans]
MCPFVEGVRDLLPEEIRQRKWVYQKLRKVFEKSGYQEVATPTLESLDLYAETETLLSKEQMFKVVNESGQILVLRPDGTLPIARLAATRYTGIPQPWKFSYITTAYQTNGGQSERMKEKTQAGIELLGSGDILADVEVIGTLIQALKEVGINKPVIDLGQVALVEEILTNLSLDELAKEELCSLMEEKNVEEIRLRIQNWNLSKSEEELLTRFPVLFGEPEEVLAQLYKLPLTEKARKVVCELEEIYEKLKEIGLAQYITFDPSMGTQLGYYTGIIFKAYVKGYGEVVASGGRYDRLAKQFGLDVPAVGFAINIEGLMTCLRQFDIIKLEKEPRVVLQVSNEGFAPAYRLANLLKEWGINAELYTGKKVFEYCKFHQIPYIGQWKDGIFSLVDQDGKKTFEFSGGLKEVALRCWTFLTGGKD